MPVGVDLDGPLCLPPSARRAGRPRRGKGSRSFAGAPKAFVLQPAFQKKEGISV